jgi:hypothetical protein
MPHQYADVARDVPRFYTAAEPTEKLRTSRQAIYAMTARSQRPGLTRIGRRVRFERAGLLALVRAVNGLKGPAVSRVIGQGRS